MPMSEEARREAISKAMEAYAESPGQEAIQLPYKDGTEGPFSVITVPLKAVLFNPRSHRIKSQLESDAGREKVVQDPYGEEAQEIIHKILAQTEGFDALKANLKEYGQRDPGVVTRAGLLVNANTRLAALRELDPNGYVRAAVLPSDADDEAIDRLELQLQVQRDFKQDYTFTNELLFINELLDKHGYSAKDAAKALNWAASGDEKELTKGVARVEQSVRLYAAVRAVQGMSDGAIPLTFFDDKKQILSDLDDKYQSLKGSDPVGAERMKEARLLGLLTESDYRDLRRIDGTTSIENLLPELEETESLGDDLESLMSAASDGEGGNGAGDGDDADILAGDVDEAQSKSFEPLVELVAKSYGNETLKLPSGGTVDRTKAVDDIVEAFETSAEDVRQDSRASKTLAGPIRALEEALKKARAAATGYEEVHTDDEFNHGKYGYLVKKIRTQLDAIETAIKQHDAAE